jgi:hypothetical protein
MQGTVNAVHVPVRAHAHVHCTDTPTQVSHHPPVCAAHAENKHFQYDLVSAPTTKFLGNSLEVYPHGEGFAEAVLPEECGMQWFWRQISCKERPPYMRSQDTCSLIQKYTSRQA